jgi:hypothetical protein
MHATKNTACKIVCSSTTTLPRCPFPVVAVIRASGRAQSYAIAPKSCFIAPQKPSNDETRGVDLSQGRRWRNAVIIKWASFVDLHETGGRNTKEGRNMKRTLSASLLALTIAFAPGVAVAKGCITGAIAGGVAGHWSGHGTLTGAVVGCITGHTAHKVHEKMRERAAQQRAQEPARRAQPRVIEAGAAAPGHVHSVHNRTAYMYVPPHRSHTHKITPEGRAATGE